MDLARLVLRLSALGYGGIGLAFLVAPAAMGSLVDLSLTSTTADNDVRAVYGGVALGLGGFFWHASTRPPWFGPGLAVLAATAGAMAAARIVSWLAAGLPAPIAYLLHAIEVVGLVAGLVALRKLRAVET